jgi:DNA invertase Pin-like site-specific DNA recombinase
MGSTSNLVPRYQAPKITHGDGFPRQRATIKEYAAKRGIKIVQVCEERGVTGTKELIDRPALSALMVAFHSDGIKVVLIEALNRLPATSWFRSRCPGIGAAPA